MGSPSLPTKGFLPKSLVMTISLRLSGPSSQDLW
jgi:hypothetical protein